MCSLTYLKALDRVWHNVLLFKLKQNGVSQNLFFDPKTLKYWVGVQWGQAYLVLEKSASLVLVGHHSSDGVTIKMPYEQRYFLLPENGSKNSILN